MKVIPLTLAEANNLVAQLHRHHGPVVGHRFSIGIADGDKVVGAAIIGRPVARMLDDGLTAEVTRCVTDGTPHACSMLYAAAWRAWRAMGGNRLITYTLASESGASVKAAGWTALYQTAARTSGWDTPSRPRVPTPQVSKTLWEMVA